MKTIIILLFFTLSISSNAVEICDIESGGEIVDTSLFNDAAELEEREEGSTMFCYRENREKLRNGKKPILGRTMDSSVKKINRLLQADWGKGIRPVTGGAKARSQSTHEISVQYEIDGITRSFTVISCHDVKGYNNKCPSEY